MLGKLIGSVIAAPIKVAVNLPNTAAEVVDEIAKAFDDPKPGKK